LNTSEPVKVQQPKQTLSESKVVSEITGDKTAKKEIEHEDQANLIEFKRLAGL
jgi:hypothetical protein